MGERKKNGKVKEVSGLIRIKSKHSLSHMYTHTRQTHNRGTRQRNTHTQDRQTHEGERGNVTHTHKTDRHTRGNKAT